MATKSKTEDVKTDSDRYDVVVTYAAVNLRSKPSSSSRVADTVCKGVVLHAVGCSGEWVELEDGSFVQSRLVTRVS